jgi:hypothetical protein
MPENAVGGRYANLRVDDLETVDYHSVGSGLDPKADQFEKTGVCRCTNQSALPPGAAGATP